MAKEETELKMKLPAEVRKRLTEFQPDMIKAENAIGTLKKLGLDTAELEDKLRWAKETRDILLKDFS